MADTPHHGLILAIGNPLRGDDGVGQALLEQVPPLVAERLCCQQLLPEHAALLSRHPWVVLVDAAVPTPVAPPGTVCGRVVHSDYVSLYSSTHHMTPACLLGWTRLLYPQVPRCWLITITGATFDYSIALSPAVRQALPQALQMITECLRSA